MHGVWPKVRRVQNTQLFDSRHSANNTVALTSIDSLLSATQWNIVGAAKVFNFVENRSHHISLAVAIFEL